MANDKTPKLTYRGLQFRIIQRPRGEMLDNMGTFFLENQEIRICQELSSEMKRMVLMHEILEMIKLYEGLEIDHSTIVILANSLYEIFVNNPNILRSM